MSEQKIEVIIDPLGDTTIEAHGFQGCGCTEKTRPYESAFGGAADRKLKDDYYESEGTKQEEHEYQW